MSFTGTKRREIKNYILRKIDEDDEMIVSKTADAFGISSTSVKRYFDAEMSSGHICPDKKRACGYALVFEHLNKRYSISEFSEREDYVLYKDFLPFLDCNENAGRIWRYVLPEMFNNALEHSEGKSVRAYYEKCYLYTKAVVTDDGIGIFTKVMNTLRSRGIAAPMIEDAVAELYKGKFTSCPSRHTGEGIFFSMRMLDRFSAASEGEVIRTGYGGEPSFVRSHLLAYTTKLSKIGTVVVMQLENDTRRDISKVFDEYADVDDGFIRTRIPVFEACMDRDPVARSQARRLSLRLNSFKEVILDFDKVDIMGQGFADELFRVYHNAHPEVTFTPVNMNGFVRKMYMHAVNSAD